MSNRIITTDSSVQTYELGQRLGSKIESILKSSTPFYGSLKFGFTGDLGAGKTLMIKGIMSKIMPLEDITSPTFTIINEYESYNRSILHVDLYRINNLHELEGTGFFEALANPMTVMFIEWIDRLGNGTDNLYGDIVKIQMNYVSPEKRKITIKNWSEEL